MPTTGRTKCCLDLVLSLHLHVCTKLYSLKNQYFEEIRLLSAESFTVYISTPIWIATVSKLRALLVRRSYTYLAAAVTPDDWRPPSAHFFIVLLDADLFCALRLSTLWCCQTMISSVCLFSFFLQPCLLQSVEWVGCHCLSLCDQSKPGLIIRL